MPERSGDYIAVTHEGAPVLLISTGQHAPILPGVKLRHLAVDYCARCRIREGNDEVEGQFVLVTCGSEEPGLYGVFLDVLEAMVSSLPIQPSKRQVHTLIGRLAELFQSLTRPPLTTVKGLWAELFVILNSTAPADWVQAWHARDLEKFDFSFQDIRVDVKSTERPQRVHEFALEQVAPPAGVRAFIASLMLRQSASGPTVEDLIHRLAGCLGGRQDLIEKTWANVMSALGADFAELCVVGFDEPFARQSLRFIEAGSIPRPVVTDPSVTRVKFAADVTAQARDARLRLDTYQERS